VQITRKDMKKAVHRHSICYYDGLSSRWPCQAGRWHKEALLPNRNLSPEELKLANQLLADVRERLKELSGDDALLHFAYRRKVMKELSYDERGKPAARNKLKAMKWGLQNGKCAHCKRAMDLKYSELDRKNASDGYTPENTDLVHAKCHHERQAQKNYT
jgi:hypothetical protein